MMSGSTDEAGPSGVKGNCNSSDFDRIEDLIRGSTFSREDVIRLVEILNSRAVVGMLDSRAEVRPEKNNSSSNAEADVAQDSLMHEIRTPTPEKQQDVNRTLMKRFSDQANVAVGASPVDIARAFMAGRTLERGHDLHTFTSKDERIQTSHDFAIKPFTESPLPKSSICWPGSVVPDRYGYSTPQSQRSRYGPHDFTGTPYSRINILKATAKVQAGSRLANASTPFQQSQTPILGQVWSRGETVEGEGSVGPIRRIRNKFATEVRQRGSIFRSVPGNVPPKVVKPNEFTGFLHSANDSLEPAETGEASKNSSAIKVSNFSDTGLRDPNPTASQAVRKILEHLDRTKPTTLNEKETELIAASKRRNSSTSGPSSVGEEKTNSLNFGDVTTNKSIYKAGPSFPAEFVISSIGKRHHGSEDEANIVDNNDVQTSSTLFADPSKRPAANAVTSFDVARNSGASINNLQGNVFSSSNNMQKEKSVPTAGNPPSKGNDKNPLSGSISKNHTTKHLLPPISTSKPYFQAVPSNNGSSFSFPVSASSSIFTEPPTPSIMPSSPPVKVPSEPQDALTIPSYEIGKNRSTKRIVFSFPNASSSEAPEASDIKFPIGSDKKRLSFGAFEKNAICS